MEIEFHKHASFTGLTPKHRRSYTLALSVFQFDGGLGRRLGHDHNGERENQQQRKRKQNCAFHGTHIIARSSLASAGSELDGSRHARGKMEPGLSPFQGSPISPPFNPGLAPGAVFLRRFAALCVLRRGLVPGHLAATCAAKNFNEHAHQLCSFVPVPSRLCPDRFTPLPRPSWLCPAASRLCPCSSDAAIEARPRPSPLRCCYALLHGDVERIVSRSQVFAV